MCTRYLSLEKAILPFGFAVEFMDVIIEYCSYIDFVAIEDLAGWRESQGRVICRQMVTHGIPSMPDDIRAYRFCGRTGKAAARGKNWHKIGFEMQAAFGWCNNNKFITLR